MSSGFRSNDGGLSASLDALTLTGSRPASLHCMPATVLGGSLLFCMPATRRVVQCQLYWHSWHSCADMQSPAAAYTTDAVRQLEPVLKADM